MIMIMIMMIFMAQGALGTAGVRRVWAGAGLQRAVCGGISCGLVHSLFEILYRSLHFRAFQSVTDQIHMHANCHHLTLTSNDVMLSGLSVCLSVRPSVSKITQ